VLQHPEGLVCLLESTENVLEFDGFPLQFFGGGSLFCCDKASVSPKPRRLMTILREIPCRAGGAHRQYSRRSERIPCSGVLYEEPDEAAYTVTADTAAAAATSDECGICLHHRPEHTHTHTYTGENRLSTGSKLITGAVRNPIKMSDSGFLKTEPKLTSKFKKTKTQVSAIQFAKNDFDGLGTIFHLVSFTIHLPTR